VRVRVGAQGSLSNLHAGFFGFAAGFDFDDDGTLRQLLHDHAWLGSGFLGGSSKGVLVRVRVKVLRLRVREGLRADIALHDADLILNVRVQ
jgi:hypothetical protein